MEKLDTYNRVPHLKSQTPYRLRLACQLLLSMLAALCLLGPWLFSITWIQALSGFLVILSSGLLLNRLQATRRTRCRFCLTPLDKVTRPLLLTPKLLSLEGEKLGNHFYTRIKSKPWTSADWVKLSNRTLVCHHCRLTEESYHQVQERPSPQELHRLKNQQKDRENLERSNFDQPN